MNTNFKFLNAMKTKLLFFVVTIIFISVSCEKIGDFDDITGTWSGNNASVTVSKSESLYSGDNAWLTVVDIDSLGHYPWVIGKITKKDTQLVAFNPNHYEVCITSIRFSAADSIYAYDSIVNGYVYEPGDGFSDDNYSFGVAGVVGEFISKKELQMTFGAHSYTLKK